MAPRSGVCSFPGLPRVDLPKHSRRVSAQPPSRPATRPPIATQSAVIYAAQLIAQLSMLRGAVV